MARHLANCIFVPNLLFIGLAINFNLMLKRKIKEWLKRYFWADTLSTIVSIFVAWAIKETTNDRVLSAFLASVAASVIFYGVIILRDVKKSMQSHRLRNKKYQARSILIDFRNLMVEFGPAEVLDVLAVRPFFMYLIPTLMTNFIVGSFYWENPGRHLVFYTCHPDDEVRKKYLK